MCHRVSNCTNHQPDINLSNIINYLLYPCECDECKIDYKRIHAGLKIRKYFRNHVYRDSPIYNNVKSIHDKTTDYKYKTWMDDVTNTIIDYRVVIKLPVVNKGNLILNYVKK
jgi:hypothetical protein